MANDNQNNTQSTLIQNQLQCLQNIYSLTMDHITSNKIIECKHSINKISSLTSQDENDTEYIISKWHSKLTPRQRIISHNKHPPPPQTSSTATCNEQIHRISTHLSTHGKMIPIISFLSQKHANYYFIAPHFFFKLHFSITRYSSPLQLILNTSHDDWAYPLSTHPLQLFLSHP